MAPRRSSSTVTPVLSQELPVSITPALARRIEIWPVDRLVPYARNARTHSDEQVAQIAASIAEFGFNESDPGGQQRRDHRRPWSAAGGAQVGPGGSPGRRAGPPQRDAEAGVHHRRQQARGERRLGRRDAGRGTRAIWSTTASTSSSWASPTRNWRRCWPNDGDEFRTRKTKSRSRNRPASRSRSPATCG